MHGNTNGEMRVTVGFRTTNDVFISETHFVATSNSAGWLGTIAASPFVARQQEVVVPAGAGKIRVSPATGCPVPTIGAMVIDDLTVAPHRPTVPAVHFSPTPTFQKF